MWTTTTLTDLEIDLLIKSLLDELTLEELRLWCLDQIQEVENAL